ncbi:polysaccharide biosynthesis tyrosine autokinase [Pseudothioclava nitratireducens]|uniref:polysaccharide biosynthesis tyrosine autokinase n=1 Tax=Pseudothioclava nitratireducens TaxID=1928646 RepID=UPI0023DAB464|nr:polysaccharide biosynthesis tyrosine autokinase [Defluviimonas nitratireducens]MDF1621540.1 polysaccharide biosynthesis tyrosine autokinase [Defluviimonas nitratireducens]
MRQFGIRIAESSNSMDPAAHGGLDTIDLSRVLAAIRRQRWTIGLSVLFWIGFGVFYVVTTPKQYFASSTVMLDSNIGRAAADITQLDDVNMSDSGIASAQLVITSDGIARAVVDDLRLDQNPSFLNPPSSAIANIIGSVRALLRKPIDMLRAAPEPVIDPNVEPPPPPTPEEIAMMRKAMVARALQGQIGVERIGRSAAFGIWYSSHDPVIAASVVNAYAEAYVADVLNANYEATERMTQWLQGRLQELEASARAAAVAADRFRSENGLVSSRGSLMSEEAVANLNADLTVAIAEAARAEARVKSYEAIVERGPDALRDGVPMGVASTGDADFVDLQRKLSDAIVNLERIRENFGPDHPQLRAFEARVEDSAARLHAAMTRLLEEARGEQILAEARIEALRGTLQNAVNENAEAGSAQIELNALESRASTLAALHQTFLTRFQEIDQQKTFPISNVRVLSLADIPRVAAGPSTTRTLLMMIVLGLMTGAVIGALREWRDRFIRTAEDVQLDLRQAFLGYLPLFSTTDRPVRAKPLPGPRGLRESTDPPMSERATTTPRRAVVKGSIYALDHMRSLYAETLRNIRLSAEITAADDSRRVIGVTSVRPGEGKSSVSLNLAGMIAASGASVLLIDGDPRRPGLSRGLGLKTGPGLIEVLLGKTDWRDALRDISDTGVELLPCIAPDTISHTSELLGTRVMRSFLDDVRMHYDFVIVDLAPIGPVVDARTMLRQLTHVVMVAEWGKTPKAMLRSVLANDPALAQKTMGVVLNKVNMTKLRDWASDESAGAYLDEYSEYIYGSGRAKS